ncbi:unnamed protein product [Chrysodeixis includens]|uniref:Uncharacterized protein n=1 Tax=Chrysodeixis includens TaxID=689277 RepID=A0A9P0FWA9_CHRIL|nr:unnamed protein product [Chrysodeixis includens]
MTSFISSTSTKLSSSNISELRNKRKFLLSNLLPVTLYLYGFTITVHCFEISAGDINLGDECDDVFETVFVVRDSDRGVDSKEKNEPELKGQVTLDAVMLMIDGVIDVFAFLGCFTVMLSEVVSENGCE